MAEKSLKWFLVILITWQKNLYLPNGIWQKQESRYFYRWTLSTYQEIQYFLFPSSITLVVNCQKASA